MKLQYVGMDELIDDVLTKPLARVKFEYFRERLQRGSDEPERHALERVLVWWKTQVVLGT